MKKDLQEDATGLDRAVQSFLGFVRSLPPGGLGTSETEPWGPREVLIHLVFWHEQYATLAAAPAANASPTPLKGTIDQINRAAVFGCAQVPVEELAARWEAAQIALDRIAQGAAAHRLSFPLRQGAKAWRLPDLLRIATRHIQNHQAKLAKSAR
jgi:hypothetical protein